MFAKLCVRSTLPALVALGVVSFANVAPAAQDVVDTIAATGSNNTLVQAIRAAGLDSKLREKGPFTVFAPTDKAFADLPKGTVETLLKPENKGQLTKILSYHVVPGNVRYDVAIVPLINDTGSNSKLFNVNKKLKTVEGGEITISEWEGTANGTWVNNFSKVTKADVTASNGVVHVVDRVLLPKAQ